MEGIVPLVTRVARPGLPSTLSRRTKGIDTEGSRTTRRLRRTDLPRLDPPAACDRGRPLESTWPGSPGLAGAGRPVQSWSTTASAA